MTHYDTRLTPTLTLVVSGPTAILAYDGDLTQPARLTLADLPALRRALSVWEVSMSMPPRLVADANDYGDDL
jgi:hypothetical protein